MIYIASHIPPKPSGGVQRLYRHVDVLNRHGIPARILHNAEGERARWFENSTPIVYWEFGRGVRPRTGEDVLVVPEPLVDFWAEAEPAATKVIFNQNAYNTFNTDRKDRPYVPLDKHYMQPPVVGALCVSEDSRRYLEWAFPDLFLQRIRYGIDPALFRPRAKLPQIAYMPRRGAKHAAQVIGLLKLRGGLEGWTFAPIDGKTEAETAEILGNSAIFMSFSEMEGFGLPPAEAMACECVVVGYHGMGGREFFLPEHSFAIESGDILEYARTVRRVIEMHRRERAKFDAIGRTAGEFIRARYTLELEEADIVNAWRNLLAKNQGSK